MLCVALHFARVASKHQLRGNQERGVFPGFAEGVIANGKSVFLNLAGFTDKNKQYRMSERTLFRGSHGRDDETWGRCLAEGDPVIQQHSRLV